MPAPAPTDKPGVLRRGFTMVELAVAIALATLIVAGLYQLFIMQSRQLQFLDMQTEMNQNLRFAADVLTRTVRQAGLGTGEHVTGVLGNEGVDSWVLNPVTAHNAHTAGNGSDAITVVHMDPSLTMNTSTMFIYPTDTDHFTFDMSMQDYDSVIQNYAAGEFLLCYDFANPSGMESYLWVISSVDTGDPSWGEIYVADNTGFTDYTTVAPPGQNLTSVMTCSKGEVVTFYIDDNDDGMGPGSAGHPVLMMDLDHDWPEDDDVPLVDDIEDLQFAYCLEDLDGTTPCTSTTSWNDDLATTEWPWMVRINVLARSRREEATGKFPGLRPAVEDNSAASTADSYYRQLLTTEVLLRNMRFYTNLTSG